MNYTAFVTGTDHGVGLALVKNLLGRGYHVIAGRLNEKETEIDDLQKEYPDRLEILTLDIGSDASVAAMKEKVHAATDHIDLLINNAGILGDMYKNLGDDLDFDEMLRVMNINSLGPLRVSNALVDLVIASEGKTIVNISSEAGSIDTCWRTGWFGYCMSKCANNMQGAIVYNNIREQGGRVIQMHPGHVRTFMRGHLDTTGKLQPDESAAGILTQVLDTELPQEEHPVYIDYSGERWPW